MVSSKKSRKQKTYEYKIINRNIAVPTERLYSHFVYYDMDIGAMEEAAGYLVGEHDFKSFVLLIPRYPVQ